MAEIRAGGRQVSIHLSVAGKFGALRGRERPNTPSRPSTVLAVAAAVLLSAFGPERNAGLAQPAVHGSEQSNPCADDGRTVYDAIHHVCWLADGNLAAKEKFGVSGINRDGSMSFHAAHDWVKALNDYDHHKGWLGHHNWLLPTTAADGPGCTKNNSMGGGGFAYGCRSSGLGALYYGVLHLQARTNVLPIRGSRNGPFRNLQPNFYWSLTIAANPRQGYQTFSFNTGWQGTNTKTNTLFVLPMVRGRLPRVPAATGNELELSADGKTVYDPVSDVTWLADANLAAANPMHVPGIGPDGAMDWETAGWWVDELRNAAYAGSELWELPDIGTCGGYTCKHGPLAQLFAHLHLLPGETVNSSGARIGGLENLQPYMYWACNGEAVPGPCEGQLPRGMGWNFSFANGFQGTALPENAFYVLPYYPVGPTNEPPG